MEFTQDTNRPSVSYAAAAWACIGFTIRNQKRTNHRVRLLHTYAFLRYAAEPSGIIKNPHTGVLAAACGLSRNTFKTWMGRLQQDGWINWTGNQLKVKSEKEVYALLGLSYGKPGDLRFYFTGDIKGLKQPYYWIFLANIEDNQRRQAYRFVQKVKTSEVAMQWLLQYLEQYGHDKSIIEREPGFIAAIFKTVYLELFAKAKNSELMAFLQENRPDVNRSVRGMARQYNTGASTISRLKGKLEQQDLAVNQKIDTLESPARNHNKHAHVRYNKEEKVTFHAFCDDIVPRKAYVTNSEEEPFKPP